MWGRAVLALLLAATLPLAAGAQTADPASDPVTGSSPDATAGQNGSAAPVLSAPHRINMPTADEVEQVAIMTIDQERLFLTSDWGRRMQQDLEALGQALADENERIADQFTQEEQELTLLRDTLPPEEFRARAEAFDKRVIEVRRERDSKSRELQQRADQERTGFFQAALPVLGQLMQERGAVVVLDQRMIFVSADKIDVTQELISRINQEVGAGAPPDMAPDPVPDSPDSPDATADGNAAEPAPAE